MTYNSKCWVIKKSYCLKGKKKGKVWRSAVNVGGKGSRYRKICNRKNGVTGWD